MRFIRKNGRVIPIRDASEKDKSEAAGKLRKQSLAVAGVSNYANISSLRHIVEGVFSSTKQAGKHFRLAGALSVASIGGAVGAGVLAAKANSIKKPSIEERMASSRQAAAVSVSSTVLGAFGARSSAKFLRGAVSATPGALKGFPKRVRELQAAKRRSKFKLV